ncbi:hypothetical protein AAAU51_11340 [Anaerostipes amylophilus]|uniref:Uncharacterized protein n=1 Tax=Anaerostipes amylophilus TaxID=2981779 RepID=A0ABV1IX15_9FIRM
MRRRVMTAFMCAIMTMSVIPVNADDTQVAKAVHRRWNVESLPSRQKLQN